MNKDLIIWNDARENTTSISTELGLACELFVDCSVFVVDNKNNKKKTTLLFRGKDGKTATVIMQTKLSDDFKLDKFKITQALSFPVVRMERLERVLTRDEEGKPLTTELISDKPSLWLGKPGQGWLELAKMKVETVTNYEDLAV